jgi:hypothetical protein
VPDLSLGRLRAILDFGEHLWFDPNALMHDRLCVRLRLPDQRLQFLLEVSGGSLVEAVVDLACVEQVIALAAADIDAVPLGSIECEAGDRQRLALDACLLDPIASKPSLQPETAPGQVAKN